MDNMVNQFPITIYGNLVPVNDVISKARCRIFYKYGNRNGSYITDEFAEILLASLPYTPVKGIFDSVDNDYTDHGRANSEGRIYGIVPEQPNIAWEKFVDEDGIEREYACADVYIFTALYEEAKDIIGKGQSMELYSKSIKGDWQVIDGKKYYVFTEGRFLGLQVLGDDVEPCFEGAAFFSLYNKLAELVKQLESQNIKYTLTDNGGEKQMNNLLFKLSDEQKYYFLNDLLNDKVDEDGYRIWTINICAVYDEYAVCFDYENNSYFRAYYIKDDENDSVKIIDRVPCVIMDVTLEEKEMLEKIHALNNNTYENLDVVFETAESQKSELENANTKIADLEQKNLEYEANIATLSMDKENLENDLVVANNTLKEVNADLDALKTYKYETEKQAKLNVINEYAHVLPEDLIAQYTAEVDSFNIEDLDMHLTYAQKKHNPQSFTSEPAIEVPKAVPATGIEAILQKHKK